MIKVGDRMLIRNATADGGEILPVTKVCKRYFECGHRKWSNDLSMRLIGASKWCMVYIRPATAEDESIIAAYARRSKVRMYDWSKADQNLIDAVYLALIKKETACPASTPPPPSVTPEAAR